MESLASTPLSSFSTDNRHLHHRRLPGKTPTRRINFSGKPNPPKLEQPGGKLIVELVGALDDLTSKLTTTASSSSSAAAVTTISPSTSALLFKTLKLSIPLLLSSTSHSHLLPRALSLSISLVDLLPDPELLSAAILSSILHLRLLTLSDVRSHVDPAVAHLLHEWIRVKNLPTRIQPTYDQVKVNNLAPVHNFILTYYDHRALVLELALRLDQLRLSTHQPLPKHQLQTLSLDALQIYSPLAQSLGFPSMSLQLEDLAFHYLFPSSYVYLDGWLKSHESGSEPLIDVYRSKLSLALAGDRVLTGIVEDVSIHGRYKSRASTMKKMLKDGRRKEEVNDILGLRVILKMKGEDGVNSERGCYRVREVIKEIWEEVPERFKDYIRFPKENGYKSLHMAVDVTSSGGGGGGGGGERRRRRPLMEIQIRTAEMDAVAIGGTASHGLYKGGVTNVEEAKHMKAIMLAAAELEAVRIKDYNSTNLNVEDGGVERRNCIFDLLDKNGDGSISIEELKQVMEELGADSENAMELMELVDTNSDGYLSLEEFHWFQRQVRVMRNLKNGDSQ